MPSGNISVSTSNQYISGNIAWSESSVDLNNNTSVVTAMLTFSKASGSSTTYGDGTFYLTINGSTQTFSGNYTLASPSTITIGSYSLTVPHNADGSKSIIISASGGLPGTSFSSSSGSGTAVLTTIARGSWVNVSGTWRYALWYVNNSGTWQLSIPYVNNSGTWQQGTGS